MPSPQPSPQQIPRTLAPMPQPGAVPGAPPPAMSKMPVGVPGAPGPVLMPGVTAAAQPFLAGRPNPGAPAAAPGAGSGVAGMPGMPPMPSMPGMPPMPGLPAGRSPSMPGAAQPLVGGSGVAGMPGMPMPLAVPGQLPPTGLQSAGMPGALPGAHATPPQLMPLRTSTSSSPDPRLPPTGLAPLVAGGPLQPLQPQALQQQGLTSQSQSATGQSQSNPNQPVAAVPQRGAEEPSTAASDGVISLAGLVVPSHGARDPATRSIDVTVAEFVWLRERAPVALTATSAKDKKMVTIPAQSVELLAAGPALTAVLAAYLPRPPPSEVGTAARPIMKKDDPASDASPKAKAPRGGAASKQPSALPRDPSAELDGNDTNEQGATDAEEGQDGAEGHHAEKKKADGKDHHVGDPTNPRRVKVVDSGNSPSPARRAHDLETDARYHPSVDARHAEWSAIQKSCQRLKFSLPLDAIAAVVATRDAPQLRRVIAELYRGVRRHDLAVKSTKAKTGALTSGPSSSKFTKNTAGAAVAAGRAGGPPVGPGRAIPHRLEPMDRGAARAIASGHPTAGLPHSTSPSPARAVPLSAGSPMKHSSVAGALEHVGATHNSGVVSSAVYPGAPPRFKRKVRKDASCQTEGLCIILPIDKPPPMTGWISDPIWRSAIPGGVARIGAGTKSSKAPADENVSPAVAHGVQQAKARVGAAGAGQTVPVSERPEWVSGKARRAVPVSTSAAELRDHRTRDDPDHKLRKKTRGVVNENDSATASTSASPTKQMSGGPTPSISAASAVPSSVAEKQSPANLRYESEAKKRELQALAGGGQGIVKHLSLNDDDDATPQHGGDSGAVGGASGEEAQQEDAGDAEGTAAANEESNEGAGGAKDGGADAEVNGGTADGANADDGNTASNGRFTFGFTEDESRADDAAGGGDSRGALRSDGDSDSDADQNDDDDERPSTAADREKAEVEAFANFHRAVSFGGPLHAMKSKKSDNDNGDENEGADNEGDDGTHVTFGRGAGGGKKVKRRPTVCAEAITDADLDAFVPDVIEKSDPNAREFLKAVLEKHELFSHLEDHELYIAVDAMQEAERGEGDVLFEPPMDGEAPTSDDDGDTFFVVGSGRVALRTKQSPDADAAAATAADNKDSNDNGAGKQDNFAIEVDDEGFKTTSVLESGATTQELMLMYPAPHTEQGVALDDGTVTYMLDRKTYRSVLSQASKKKRALYEGFLSTVSFLEHLDKRDLLQLADALKPATYAPGEHLITYGEKGKNFFLIVEGTVEVFGRDKDGNRIKVCEFTVGDCVGELEFINHHDCVADVVAKGSLDDEADVDADDVDVEDKSEGETNADDHQSSDGDERKDDEENPNNSASAAKPTPANVTKLNLNNARPTSADAYAVKAEAKKEGAEVGTTEGDVENAMSGVLSARAAAAMKQLSPRITAEVIASMTATGFVGVRAAKMNRRHFEMVMGPCRDVLARNAEENKKYAYYRGKLDAIKDAREEGRVDGAEENTQGPETAAEEPAAEEITEVTKRDPKDAETENAAEGAAVQKAEASDAEGAAEDVDPKKAEDNGSAGDDTTAADAASVVAAVVAAAVEMNQERRDEAVASAAAPPSTSDNAAAQENTTAPADASKVPEDEADDIDIGEGNSAGQKALEEEGDDVLERAEKEEEGAAEAAHETGDSHNDTGGEGDADSDLEPAEDGGGEEEAAEEGEEAAEEAGAEDEEHAEEEDGSPNEEAEAEEVEEVEEGEGQAEEEEHAEDGDPDADGDEGEGEAEAEEEEAAADEEVGGEEKNGDAEDASGNNAPEGEHDEGAEAAASTDATKKIVIDTDDI